MSIKNFTFVLVSLFSVSLLSGCASSSFNEYFNEPVPVLEKSVKPNNQYNTQNETEKSKNEESSVQTFPVEDIRQ